MSGTTPYPVSTGNFPQPGNDELPPPYPGPPGESILPGYPTATDVPYPPPETQTVIVTQPLGFTAGTTFCVYCQKSVITNVSYTPGSLTYLLCVVIFLLGGCLGCCFIPFCCNDCEDAVHTCPVCGTTLGVRTRM
ncbi:Lipopolysaccharide-induced tumor necrosis factor-alpha factor [Clonorchis sinensis]|uniref:Lipopolysaccharide-induced tumor necrosis factor-alpha factor n=1 Tax=Clonorchis sinensis TaxID=79923 RepID=A0A8T1M4R8_CLOSI|nr:Lipopolysaccharide-induced tumor necrosis factor-alpha factor [Clonorchis sinensis]